MNYLCTPLSWCRFGGKYCCDMRSLLYEDFGLRSLWSCCSSKSWKVWTEIWAGHRNGLKFNFRKRVAIVSITGHSLLISVLIFARVKLQKWCSETSGHPIMRLSLNNGHFLGTGWILVKLFFVLKPFHSGHFIADTFF